MDQPTPAVIDAANAFSQTQRATIARAAAVVAERGCPVQVVITRGALSPESVAADFSLGEGFVARLVVDVATTRAAFASSLDAPEPCGIQGEDYALNLAEEEQRVVASNAAFASTIANRIRQAQYSPEAIAAAIRAADRQLRLTAARGHTFAQAAIERDAIEKGRSERLGWIYNWAFAAVSFVAVAAALYFRMGRRRRHLRVAGS